MTKKQKEIKSSVLLLGEKQVNVWLTGQMFGKRTKQEAYCEGTFDSSTGTYLILRNVLLWNGKWFQEYKIHIGKVARISQKEK